MTRRASGGLSLTYHFLSSDNMFELLKVNTMCGVCCVSMKVVVFIDLIATMILPASYVYAMYLLFLVFFEE